MIVGEPRLPGGGRGAIGEPPRHAAVAAVDHRRGREGDGGVTRGKGEVVRSVGALATRRELEERDRSRGCRQRET
jgi:hypothetical protein